MAVEKCSSCDRYVDLDVNVEGIIYLGTTAICDNCISDEDFMEYIEKLEAKINKLNGQRMDLEAEMESCVAKQREKWVKKIKGLLNNPEWGSRDCNTALRKSIEILEETD